MEEEGGFVVQWRIENISHWCEEVHGQFIESPRVHFEYYSTMRLYPKGISDQQERFLMRFHEITCAFSGYLSFYSSDKVLLNKQQFNVEANKRDLEQKFSVGLKFEEVVSQIRESKNEIIVKCQIKFVGCSEQHMSTIINVIHLSLKLNPSLIESMKTLLFVQFCPYDDLEGMRLLARPSDSVVVFTILPNTLNKFPFSVEMCFLITTRRDVKCVKKEHVFVTSDPWTFPNSVNIRKMCKNGSGVVLCLKIKTNSLIHSPYNYMNFDYNSVSIKPNTTSCFSEDGSHTDLDTVNQAKNTLSVLSKDFMCLYQDQDFSDFQLKCGNVTFPVHRIILSARSPVFKTMFASDMRETASGEVDITDLDPPTLARFLFFLYTGEMGEEDLEVESALNLYYAADKYQVSSLKRECAESLCDQVSVSNVCDILSLADRHQDLKLTSTAHDFILKNYNKVLKSSEWNNFMCRESLLAVKTLTQFTVKDRFKEH